MTSSVDPKFAKSHGRQNTNIPASFVENAGVSLPTGRPFKVGDKGKTRAGGSYEIVAVLAVPLNTQGQESLCAVVNGEFPPLWFFEDGHLFGSDRELQDDDLMAPKVVKGWLCVQKSGKVTFYSGDQAHFCEQNDPMVGRIHIDQEYEEYKYGETP